MAVKSRRRHEVAPSRFSAAFLYAILAIVGLSSALGAAGAETARYTRRADKSPNTTFVDTAIMSVLASPRANWEQGVAGSMLLETHAGEWSVFAGKEAPPYAQNDGKNANALLPSVLGMASAAVQTQDSLGRLCSRVTGDEELGAGSALDPASCGEAVLLAAYAMGEIANGVLTTNAAGTFAGAAQRQLSYLLQDAPRIANGAVSMRARTLAYWSDGVYMAPPFVALYGLMTNNQTLLQAAYDQVRLYRDALRIPSGPAEGLFRHIVNGSVPTGTGNDLGAWATGNGWSAAGMCKVLAAIAQSRFAASMSDQINDLGTWSSEIVSAALSQGQPLVHNYVNDTTTFYDAGASALIAYSTFRLASMLRDADLGDQVQRAESVYQQLQDKLTPAGSLVAGYSVANPLSFVSSSQRSPESMAFMALMAAARRDYGQNNVTGTTGPGSGATNGASSWTAARTGVADWLLAVAAASLVLAIVA